ncbi:MAG: insulinase family protein [Bacteroidales bacterium]|jgi:predicted Zn-dependent peptidase|nr:insulinase family protein [Bacteroidales bacterium]
MKMFKQLLSITAILAVAIMLASCGGKYKYESVKGDPMKTRIYTLENGLKVYLSVNKDEPRVQTMIAVDAGSRNDPSETTGLAHYLEHIMFKGTSNFGTIDFDREKPYLDAITALYEVYRKTTDEQERKNIYKQIDSISQIAATIAIPNEYDKLMAAIGAQGTNAFTSYDLTAYVEDVPSNQIENWLKIQSDRFQNMVIRLFHTELETVYEEYNLYLTYDDDKASDALLNALLPHHPYGTQTVIGTQEHLKNPSIINIQNFFKTYYVPNNMAVIMAGDFNPDEVIKLIDKYFGSMKPGDVPERKFAEEKPIEKPVERTVTGLEPAKIFMGYRLPNAKNDATIEVANLFSQLLSNGKTGLIDLNLLQKQQVLSAYSFYYELADYGFFGISSTPKQGQTLNEVRALLLAQIDSIKQGNFSEEVLKGVIENYRVNEYQQLRYNFTRTYSMLDAFILDKDWEKQVKQIDNLAKITKQDIVDFANKYFNENYAVVYKEQGTPDNKKVEKPAITTIPVNRDTTSAFMRDIALVKPKDIEPVFVDFKKDMKVLPLAEGVDVLYKQNDGDPLFEIDYVFEMGSKNDPYLPVAFKYFEYLGTDKYTPEQLKKEFYNLGTTYNVFASGNRVYVYMVGIKDNFEKSLDLFEELLANIKADEAIYKNVVSDILKERADSKTVQDENFYRLVEYARYGEKNPSTYILSESELKSLDPNVLTDKIKGLSGYKHNIIYYGTESDKALIAKLKEKHKLAPELKDVLPEYPFELRNAGDKPKIFVAQYDAENIYLSFRNYDIPFNKEMEAIRGMYNDYFGGGMSSIVFQEMREARGLAYSANFGMYMPERPSLPYGFSGFIATQNDKLKDALLGFDGIINDMPVSEKSFEIAKENSLNAVRTKRVLRSNVLWTYLHYQKFGFENDFEKKNFEKMQAFTLDDVVKFQQEQVKGRKFNYAILGDIKRLDMNYLKSLGEVQVVDQKTLFGY